MIATMPEWVTMEVLLTLIGFTIALTVFVMKVVYGKRACKPNEASLAEKMDVALCTVIMQGNEKDHKTLNDCIESEVRVSAQRHAELKADINQRHIELKEEMRAGFEKVDGLFGKVFDKLDNM